MAKITQTILSDEKTYQIKFYESIFGIDNLENNINIDRSTDGYTKGIIFEHKTNVTAYGRSKALSQALIYLTRFNADGIPVPGKIMLICQDKQIAYLYDANEYADIINDIPQYGTMKASSGIEGFAERSAPKEIKFDISSASGMFEILTEVNKPETYVKVNIDIHNVYGWSGYYYRNAESHGQKPEKKKFFEELSKPVGTLEKFINPWTGKETDFTLIMDLLNDPKTQKKLGAFYTPEPYCELAHDLLLESIKRVPEGNDYVIIDRCAGTGNLEAVLTDEELSHVIVNTYELKEWYVLKDRIGNRVRHIIPPIPQSPTQLPNLNQEGFLSGANALTRDLIDNPFIKQYIDDPKCTIILYENPPYAEIKEGGEHNQGMDSFMKEQMKNAGMGKAVNDIANIFIWSGFEYFLRQPTDSYVVFSPVKYWKAQRIIKKKFLDGYAFNRQHFHAPTPACIMCALWSNEDDEDLNSIKLKAYDIDNNWKVKEDGTIDVKQIFSLFSETYYDSTTDESDNLDGIAISDNGTESDRKGKDLFVQTKQNDNILGYLIANSSGFDMPRLTAVLTVAGHYRGHGFFLRKNNCLEKLPMFAASRYTDHANNWKVMSMVMKSGDGKEKFLKDVEAGKLNDFLCKCLIWTGLTHYGHIRSLNGSDGRNYTNQLCFDGEDTFASKKLKEFIENGYVLTPEEENLFADWKAIISRVKQQYADGSYRYPYNAKENTGYNPNYKYGLYQIDEEVNFKIDSTPDRNGKIKKIYNDGDLNNMIKAFKLKVKDYYLNNLVGTLFEYEFLK